MDEVFTTYESARICHVHHTTVINWIKERKLKAYATPGGHRRVRRNDLVEFMTSYKIPLPEDFQSAEKMVLVVDDDKEALDEMKSALNGHGFTLDFATNGFEAARKVYRKKPSLLLLDFCMPGIDGFQVCADLQRDPELKQIPVFAVTALTSQEDVRRIKASGVKKFIPKPVDIERLVKAIKESLGL